MKSNINLKGKQVTRLNFEGPYTIPVTSSNGISFSCTASSTIKLNASEIGHQEQVEFYPLPKSNHLQK